MTGTWEQLTLQDPPGNTAADDRDAWGHVPEAVGAGGTFDTVRVLYGGVRELPAPDALRAGLEASEGAYQVDLYESSDITPQRVLYRQERDETMEIISVVRQSDGPGSLLMRAFCRRSDL